MPLGSVPGLLVGLEHPDDAVVYALGEDRAIVASLDFFTPVVDDPADFGAIAAANALSDLYAMRARPLFALNILAIPAGDVFFLAAYGIGYSAAVLSLAILIFQRRDLT